MQIGIKKQRELQEYWFKEGCFITEIANDGDDPACSIAKARVEPGKTTAWHMLEGIHERYIIVSGSGRVEVGASLCCDVAPGDVVRIPGNTRQRITNTGVLDLIFYAVCTPPFRSDCYLAL
jgi:mannose-6-phosphate isomerase-like protein (cupin superfamily)